MYDANGTPLKVGDKVLIPAVIVDVSDTEDYCNLSVKTTLGRKPDGNKESISAINTAVVVKISGADLSLGL